MSYLSGCMGNLKKELANKVRKLKSFSESYMLQFKCALEIFRKDPKKTFRIQQIERREEHFYPQTLLEGDGLLLLTDLAIIINWYIAFMLRLGFCPLAAPRDMIRVTTSHQEALVIALLEWKYLDSCAKRSSYNSDFQCAYYRAAAITNLLFEDRVTVLVHFTLYVKLVVYS